jgi:hypothetical protein
MGPGCTCLLLRLPYLTSPKLQPTDAASGNDDTVSNHMIKEKLGKYGGGIWLWLTDGGSISLVRLQLQVDIAYPGHDDESI